MKKIFLSTLIIAMTTAFVLKINSEFPINVVTYVFDSSDKAKELVVEDFPFLNSIDGFSLEGTTLNIYSKSQRLGIIHFDETSGLGDKYSPVVHVSKFDINTGSASGSSFPINLWDLTSKTGPYTIHLPGTKEIMGTDQTDLRLSAVQSAYPQCFPIKKADADASRVVNEKMSIYIGFKKYELLTVRTTATVNPDGGWTTGYTEEPIQTERANFSGEFTEATWGSLYNEKEKNITVVVGANRKDLKNNFYKEIAYVTYGSDGKIINEVNQTFEYTKDHEYFQLASNADNGSKQVVAILGKRASMGKQNDPDTYKYNLLALNPDGSKLLSAEFHYGEKARDFTPTYSFVKGGKVYVISGNNEKEMLDIFVFDASGNFTKTETTYLELMNNTYSKSGKGATVNRGLGFQFNQGYTNVNPLGSFTLSTGNILLLNEEIQWERIANPDPASAVNTPYLNEQRYRNISAIELTVDGKFVSQYVFQKDFVNANVPTTIENVLFKNDKLVILTLDKVAKAKNKYKQNYTNLSTYIKVGCGEQCKPAIFVLDAKTKTTTIMKSIDPAFVTLYGTGSYILVNNDNEVVYAGIRNDGSEALMEYKVCKFIF